MKVLFIRSGYDGIYRFLEEWLIRSWQKAGCRLKVISHTEPDFFLIEELSDFDAIFTFLGDHLTDAAIVKLSQCAAPFIIWLTEDPFNIDQSLMLIERADIILTVDRGAYDFYLSKGYRNVYYLPLGTDSSVFKPLPELSDCESDCLLIGFPYRSRVELILYLLDHLNCKMTVIGKGWHNHIPKRKRKHPYLQIIDRWIPPDKAALFYCNAKIVLNPHRSHLLHVNNNRFNIENRSLNNRTFDIAACQAFQLIDNKEVAPSFADRDIATFSSCQDCVEKITYYLTHEAIRKKKAENARQQVLAEHLMIHRAAEINKLVQAYRKNR